ncbi:ROK family transcriptional regulator [Yoonia sediminilitoris]|uniref:Putative NBD/HSP70 family sugar kinase n=1 Tax=Yoonia sediminilitoris TaxID=1286148 RepID=A0A2T6KHA3_9RHOB|nr:ROK family transcriptional regulator [Yoonia sediminilitoris]PUB14896.1 putative NBD/HSP70 family sugar kinase [Yoonia sediminilitoris]RCW95613.1 putative NBD/HSP70 family sugar kinase [Yoonia sediminilitoris]
MLMDLAALSGLDARDATRLRVLQCIRSQEEISRTDIAQALDSSPATVTSACGALLEAGLIREVERAPSGAVQRGRPRVMLQINGAAFLLAGIKIARHAFLVVIVDFKGDEIGTYALPLAESRMQADALVRRVRTALDAACDHLGVDVAQIAGIALGMPGFINGQTGFMHWSSSVIERNVDFVPLFQVHLPCPTFLDNDANLVAKAEHLFGAGRGLRNFLVVTVEHGVGMGIVLDGKLYRGERGCGAELGHSKVHIDGAVCQCGQRGCLEAYVGDYAMVRDASTGRQTDAPTSIAEILAMARAGDALAHQVLERASEILGVALANLVNLFDPEHIVLARSRPELDPPYPDIMLDALRRNTVQVDAPLPGLTVRNLDKSMWAKGAAAHGIEMLSILKVRERGAVDAA